MASVEDVGKISSTVSCVGWLRWVSSLELWLAGDAGEIVREGCAMGVNSRNKMWVLLKLQRPMPGRGGDE